MNELLNQKSLQRLTPCYHRAYPGDPQTTGEQVPFDRPVARAQALEQINEWNRQSMLQVKGWIYWLAPEDSL